MSLAEALGGHLPKLPELDKDDIKAVRRFLPGKLLGRMAALLSLALLVIVFAAAVGQGLKQLLDAGLPRLLLLLGLPLLAIAFQLLLEWRAERGRRALQRLALRLSTEQSGYFRIGPYLNTAQDRAEFHRADRAHERVLNWIERSANVPLYLTGDSGSGKSSLLNASVVPALRERGWTVVEARAWQHPNTALLDALAQLPSARRPRQGGTPALRDLVEAVARRAVAGLLLILDQFEEFVILGKPDQQQAFGTLLKDLQARPVKGLSLLLVLRSDYQTFLEDIGLPLLRYGENLYEVRRFTIAAAVDFLARSGLELQPAAIDHLLTSAAELDETPGLIRPITLNVIGYVLATGKAVAPSLDAGQLVRRYIEQTAGQPAIRDFAPRVLEQLVTEQGTKRPRTEQELVASTHLRRGEVRAVLNGLGAAALARPLDPALGVWELSHDFIARAVVRYLGRRRSDLVRRGIPYVAPALVIAMLLVVTSVKAWNSLSLDLINSQLAELGLSVTYTVDGLTVLTNSELTSDSFAESAPLLTRAGAVRSFLIGYEKVENLEPIRGLTALRRLRASFNGVKDLEPLKGLTALKSLELAKTQVDDLRPLKGLTALQSLDLSGTQVKNLEPLKGLTALQSLDLSATQVENLEPLEDLTALQSLRLVATEVKDLAPLKRLTALRSLDLYGSVNVENLGPLKSLTVLQSLNLHETKVADLAALKGLATLVSLDLSNTKVKDLAPLKGLTALQSLELYDTNVETLEPLEDLPALRSLSLSRTVSEAEVTRFNRYRNEEKLQPVEIRQ